MSFLDLGLIFFFLLVVLNYRIYRSVLYPPFIFCAVWLLVLAVFRLGLIEIDPVHGNTLAIVAAGAASFSFGGLLAGFTPRELLRIHLFPPKPEKSPVFLRNMLVIILLCGLPVLFYQILQLSKSVISDFNIVARAGVASVEAAQSGETNQSFVFNHFRPIAIAACLLFATEKKDRQFWIMTVVAFIYACFGGGRGGILILISGLGAIHLLQTKQESLKCAIRVLRWPIGVFFALFIGMNFIGKSSEGMTQQVATRGVVGTSTFFVLSYIAGPLAAFDKVVQNPADFIMTTSHTFYFPLHLAAMLHLTDYTEPTSFNADWYGWVFVPFATNVYTVFKFYFLELGTVGTMVLLVFIGLIHSLIYLKARQGGRLSIYLFAFSLITVMTVISGDGYYYVGEILRAFAFGYLYFLIGSMSLRLLPTIKLKLQPTNQRLKSSSV
jgi:oligosaccharide repeat unit polymerase